MKMVKICVSLDLSSQMLDNRSKNVSEKPVTGVSFRVEGEGNPISSNY